jgi:hypothetical protein
MKRSICDPPDPFSLSPLLPLLPVKGRVAGLAPLTTSLYARYEKVQALQKELSASEERDAARRFAAEEAMLRQVLDWLELSPGGSR